MKEEIKILYTLYKYNWYKQKNVWKNGIEKIVDNDGILWLNKSI